MARTPSTMRELGSAMPAFRLVDTTKDETFDSSSLHGSIAIVAFICNHCPFVVHLKPQLAQFGRYCQDAGAAMVAISSNDVDEYPDDSPEKMKADALQIGYPFPYLYDKSQDIARAFDAACTPDFFVFDKAGKLAYRGQFDDSRPGNGIPVTGNDLRSAVETLLAGGTPSSEQKPSIGCNIKWKR